MFGNAGLNIAHHHHGHQVGAVPVFVEALDGFMLEALETFFCADGQALGVQRAAEYFGQQNLIDAVLQPFSQAQLFQHNATLSVGIGIVKTHALCPVLQHQETLFDVVRVFGGDGQHVHRLVEAGVGVQVSAKLHPDGLQVRNQLMLLKVGGTVERHVLNHVGQPQLVFVFQNRSGLDHQTQLQPFLWATIFLYVIG